MDLLSFIRTADPIKVRIGEMQRDEDETKLLDTTVRRVVPLLPVAPDRSSGELEASVDKLFDEGELVSRRSRVIPQVVVMVLDDYGAPGGPTVGGKSQSSIQRLLAGAVQNAEVRGGVMPTLPFVSSSVSITPEREGGDHTKLLAGANLRTIGAPQRFVISSDSFDHPGVNIAEAEVDYVVRTSMPIITSATITTPTGDPAAIAKEKLVGSYLFGADSPSAGESHLIPGGFSDCTGSDFLIGGIRTLIDTDSNLQKVYFFASVREMEHEQLYTEFNVGAACQMSLSAEVRMRAKYNIREKRRLNSIIKEKDALLKAKDEEIRNLKAQLLLKESEAAEAIRLRAETSKLKATKKSIRDEVTALNERNTILEKECNALDVKVHDYGVMGTDDQSAVNESVVDEDANPLLNVDDAELNIPQ
nr:hypothetical protein [Tanacetum cinerariifolium]